jgi:hypothetical protein
MIRSMRIFMGRSVKAPDISGRMSYPISCEIRLPDLPIKKIRVKNSTAARLRDMGNKHTATRRMKKWTYIGKMPNCGRLLRPHTEK